MTRGDSLAQAPVGQAAVGRRTQGVAGLGPRDQLELASLMCLALASTWAVQLL